MEYPAAVDNIKLFIRAVIKNIGFEKAYRYLIVVCKFFCLFQPCRRDVKCCYRIAAFGEENGILAFAASQVQYTVGFYRRENFHNIIAYGVWRQSPIVFFGGVAVIIISYHAAIAKEGINGGIKGRGQLWKHCDVRVGCAVFPLGYCLEGDVQRPGKLILGKSQFFAPFADYFSCFQIVHF